MAEKLSEFLTSLFILGSMGCGPNSQLLLSGKGEFEEQSQTKVVKDKVLDQGS